MYGAILVGAGVAIGAAMAQQSRVTSPGPGVDTRHSEPATRDDFQVEVTPEMRRHSRILYTLYFVGTVYGIGVLLLLLSTGWSRRIRDLAARVTTRKFLMAMLYFVLFSIASALLSLPLDLYSGFVVPHQFNLSNQSFGEWLLERLKELAVGLVIGSPIIALALLGIRKMPRRWWLALWSGAIPIAILLVVIAPLFVDPIFNKFEPLKDAVLRDKLLELASRAGISGADVFEVDKSKQTKTMNAYVTGLGPTKRIVMWDTLLAKMTHGETLAVMGHEMGHYVLHHVWKGLALGFALFFGVLYLAQRIVIHGVARWGDRWGFSEPHDPAALPWLLIVISVLSFFLTPAISAGSRYIEHEADVFTLELTHRNEDTARAFIKLAEDSKIEPQPPLFIEYWLYSHPPLAKRIAFALSYRPWDRGEPNRAWKGGSSLRSLRNPVDIIRPTPWRRL